MNKSIYSFFDAGCFIICFGHSSFSMKLGSITIGSGVWGNDVVGCVGSFSNSSHTRNIKPQTIMNS